MIIYRLNDRYQNRYYAFYIIIYWFNGLIKEVLLSFISMTCRKRQLILQRLAIHS